MRPQYNKTNNFVTEWLEELDEVDSDGRVEHIWSVECYYTPPCRGSRGSYGEQLEPDEPADVEIIKATCKETGQILGQDEFIEKFGRECMEYFMDRAYEKIEDDYEAYCDHKYDEMKDREFDDDRY